MNITPKICKTTLIIILLWGCSEVPPVKTGLEGKPVPSFNLLLSDSTTYFNTSDIPKGKPVVLFYLSPHCPYCRAEMKEIIDKISSLKNIRFYVFTNWPFTEMKGFCKEYYLNKYTNIVAGVDYTNFFYSHFKATGVPFLAIYDEQKRMKKAFIGKISVSQIQSTIDN